MRLLDWNHLSDSERTTALARPQLASNADIEARVATIIEAVRARGDAALLDFTEILDGVRLEALEVTRAEVEAAERSVGPEAQEALDRAIEAVRIFHAAQARPALTVQTAAGVVCERLTVPIRAVGLYVPAGSAPLPSTAVMLGVPAALAGCPVRVLCTPPRRDGTAHPAIVVAARKAGIERLFKVGGAQAIAAMGYGTQTVPRSDKIFGPGNAWVTTAKMLIARDPAGTAIDLPAGPTEVMIVADESARAEFLAADLLAQAEHGIDAQALLLSTSRSLAERVVGEVERQRASLARSAVLAESLKHVRLIVMEDLEQALEVANRYAPEHLLLALRSPRAWLDRVRAAGSVFLGHWSTETLGDYCAGPNHTLPTLGWARSASGLGLEDFERRMTVQEVTPAGLKALAATARTLAALEGLDGHAAAVSVRLAALGAETAGDSP